MKFLARWYCYCVGHRWTNWTATGSIYKVSFRWCRRCDSSEVK